MHSAILRVFLLGSLFGSVSSCSDSKQSNGRYQLILDSLYHAHPESRGLAAVVSSPHLSEIWSGSIAPDSINLKATSPLLIASITKLFTSAATWVWLDSMNLSPETSIQNYLTNHRESQMRAAGYNTQKITFGQLMSCTAGLADYVETETFQNRSIEEPGYQWTREEQTALAFSRKKLAEPGEVFSYGDINFLLLTDILEQHCKKPFYSAIRDLLKLDERGLQNVYFNRLESKEKEERLIQQFASTYRVDSYSQDPSFDLYGAGGIRCNLEDLVRFTTLLYQGKFFRNEEVLAQFKSDVYLNSGEVSPYGYAQMRWFSETDTAYGHGGFWGTMVQYFPSDSTCIAVSVLDRDAWKSDLTFIEKIRSELRNTE